MTRWAAGAYPGSESGTCFHSNRSCRLAPAHQGVKIGCIGWWESSSVIATTRTSPLDSLSSQTKCNTLLIFFSRQGLEDKAKQRLASILLKGFDRARSLQLAGDHQFLEFYREYVSKNSSI